MLTPLLTVSEFLLEERGLLGNCIKLSGMTYGDSISHHHIVEVGGYVKSTLFSRPVSLDTIENQFIMILSDRDKWTINGKLPEHIVTVSISGPRKGSPDEYILLMIASNKTKNVSQESLWSQKFVNCVKLCLKSNMKTGRHNGSVGCYMGVGTTGKYQKVDGISYGEFSRRDATNIEHFSVLKHILEVDLSFAATELNSVIGGVVQAGQCITRVLINISKEIYEGGGVITSLFDGMLSAYVCENAQTKCIHTEKDCAYTLIAVPCTTNRLCRKGMFVFQFECTSNTTIQIRLKSGTRLYYSGYGIRHRQISLTDNAQNKGNLNFWNLSSFANRDLYSKAMSSFHGKIHGNENK